MKPLTAMAAPMPAPENDFGAADLGAADPGAADLGASIISRWATPIQARPGRAIYLQGDPADYCYYLVSGRVSPIRYRADDSRLALEEAGPGSILALAECYLGLSYQSDALALERCQILRLGRGGLERLLETTSSAAFLLRSLARSQVSLHSRLDSASVLERLCAYLLAQGQGSDSGSSDSLGSGRGTKRLTITQEALARAVGATRETVNRHLQGLERAGVLETGRGEILIYRDDELSRMAGE